MIDQFRFLVNIAEQWNICLLVHYGRSIRFVNLAERGNISMLVHYGIPHTLYGVPLYAFTLCHRFCEVELARLFNTK